MTCKTMRPTSGSVRINGIEATRTRKAQSPHSKRKVRELQQAQLRQTCFEMQLQYVSQADIAKALGISRPRVSQLLNAEYATRDEQWVKTADQWRAQECARIEAFLSKWSAKAETSPRAADVLRTWAERRDRILGLYTQHTSLSLDSVRSTDEPPIDWSRLNEQELKQFEYLNLKLHGIAPEPEPVYETVIADWAKAATAPAPAQITDNSRVVAIQPADETLRDKILRLYQGGMSASDIAQSLALSHSALIEAIEDHGQQDTIQ
jgi:DNA-binding transcriptional regulator LsrR (DeoR family)